MDTWIFELYSPNNSATEVPIWIFEYRKIRQIVPALLPYTHDLQNQKSKAAQKYDYFLKIHVSRGRQTYSRFSQFCSFRDEKSMIRPPTITRRTVIPREMRSSTAGVGIHGTMTEARNSANAIFPPIFRADVEYGTVDFERSTYSFCSLLFFQAHVAAPRNFTHPTAIVIVCLRYYQPRVRRFCGTVLVPVMAVVRG